MPDHSMTPDQRYCFDTSGFLHLEGVLQGAELQTAQAAVQRYVDTPTEELPPGFQAANGNYSHGFAFDKALEALTVHPRIWPIVNELTDGRPRLASGTMRVNTHEQTQFGPLHCAREGWGPQTPRYIAEGGRIYCDYFVVFFYFTDVHPGDGGLVVVPGSHKSQFKRPASFLSLTRKTPIPPPIRPCSILRPKPAMQSLFPNC